MAMPVPDEVRKAMRATIASAGGPATREGWAKLWQEKLTLGDLGAPTPTLLDEVDRAVADGSLRPAECAALVPGCGAAYDVRALAERGVARVVGADICEEAVVRARAVAGDALRASGRAELIVADFFDAADARLAPASFDLIFDYTMFCAISPPQRAAWGARMGALLRPGGRLLTLAYPLAADELAADPLAPGPPHPVSLAEYRRALEPHGFRVEPGCPRASPTSVPARVSNEQVIWWSR
jgi:SAM-dependent methyltransferase